MQEKNVRSIYKRPWLWAVVIVCSLVGVAVFAIRKPKPPEFSSIVVEQRELIQSVEETGSIVADTELHYGWERSGRVVAIRKKVGDTVKETEEIASLDA